MISTPATKLASGTVTSPSNPSHRPLDIDTLYHTRAILSVQWSVDGEHLYFDTNITGRYNIWAVPSNRGWPVQLTVSDERTLLQEPSPDGRFLLYAQDIQGDEKPNLYLLDLTEFTIRNITNTDKVGYRDAKWSPDGRSLVFAGERDGPGTYPVFHLDPDKGTIKKIIGHEAGDCESLEYSPDGHKLALTRTRNYQYTGASVYDLETGNEIMLAPIDDKSTTITGGWTRDGKKIYVTSNANDRGMDAVALLELKQGPEFQWLTLQDWDSQLVDVSPTEDRFAYVVNEAGNVRLLLRNLNGEEEEIPPTQGVVRAAKFSPDGKRLGIIHASGDSPHAIWVYDLKDLVAAVDYLKTTGYVDPNRIAITGGSRGGYLTLMALTKYPDIWAAGVSIVPLANWFTAHENEDPVLQKNDEWLMGDPVADRDLWQDRSPLFFANRIRAPLLLLAGQNDIRCPVKETEQMAEAARKNGVTVEVKIYENEGHGFVRRENEIDAIKRAAKFLETHVGQRSAKG